MMILFHTVRSIDFYIECNGTKGVELRTRSRTLEDSKLHKGLCSIGRIKGTLRPNRGRPESLMCWSSKLRYNRSFWTNSSSNSWPDLVTGGDAVVVNDDAISGSIVVVHGLSESRVETPTIGEEDSSGTVLIQPATTAWKKK